MYQEALVADSFLLPSFLPSSDNEVVVVVVASGGLVGGHLNTTYLLVDKTMHILLWRCCGEYAESTPVYETLDHDSYTKVRSLGTLKEHRLLGWNQCLVPSIYSKTRVDLVSKMCGRSESLVSKFWAYSYYSKNHKSCYETQCRKVNKRPAIKPWFSSFATHSAEYKSTEAAQTTRPRLTRRSLPFTSESWFVQFMSSYNITLTGLSVCFLPHIIFFTSHNKRNWQEDDATRISQVRFVSA